jgi:rhomboid family GlyGly-CTERM serine protease
MAANPSPLMTRMRRLVATVGPGLWIVGLSAALLVLLWAVGEGATEVLRYRRSAIMEGEWWRLITGHLVHGGFQHTLLNVAGGLVMTALFLRTYSRNQWLLILLGSLIVIDIGFLVRDRYLESYVGFSGVLHGVLAAGALAWWRTESRIMAFAITAITVGKLAWEQWEGPVSLASGMTIIVNAHLYGAIGGALVGAFCLRSDKVSSRERQRARDPAV